MNVLMVAAEGAPYVKIGGLGDVLYGLPQALARQGTRVAVVLPLYKIIKESFRDELIYLTHFSVPLAWRQLYCGIFCHSQGDVTYYFLDNEYYFLRDRVYGDYDDGERFSFFSKAVLEMLQHIDFLPDVIHAHDWQCALVPLFLKAFYGSHPRYASLKTMLTIHNIEYQGKFPISLAKEVLGISDDFLPQLVTEDCLNFMFSGICLADKVTTVSETYAKELKTAYYGGGLAPVLEGISHKFCGIVNGIDTTVFNPHNDPGLFHKFSPDHMAGKTIGKRKLRAFLNLEDDEEAPILSIVSRLVSHKGLDLIRHVRHELMERRLSLVVLGTGDAEYEDMFRELSLQYPGRVSTNICFDTALASKIYAGSDLFLMPSKSEPCGLSQLIAMVYGAIPIVRETGGLKDTVFPINPETGEGRGFTFQSYNAHDMLDAVDRALSFYYDRKDLKKQVVRRNMTTDFSWKTGAERYLAIYDSM